MYRVSLGISQVLAGTQSNEVSCGSSFTVMRQSGPTVTADDPAIRRSRQEPATETSVHGPRTTTYFGISGISTSRYLPLHPPPRGSTYPISADDVEARA